MTRLPGVAYTWAPVASAILVSLVVCAVAVPAASAADPVPIEVSLTPPPPLPPRFDRVRQGQPLYGANWPWDHYGADFGVNLWGYRGLAGQGPAGWRLETRGENQGATRLFWARRDAANHCLGVQIDLAGGVLLPNTSALLFFRFDEPAAQPQGATVDLTNQTVTARVYLPSGLAGAADARSGVMLFFQDINWAWAQTPWMNIEETDQWITISARGNDLPFNRRQVRTVGIKIGANSAASGFRYVGPAFVDGVTVSGSPAFSFDFERPHTRTELELQDFAALRAVDLPDLKIYALRWWLLADGRAGLRYDSNGFVTGIDDRLVDDLRELLRLARSTRVYLMPVLFDFLLGAEPVVVDGVQTFGRADLINDPLKRQSLLDNALARIFEELADSNEVLAIDLFNEPEWLLIDSPEVTVPPGKRPPEIRPGGIVQITTMKTFFSEIIELHRQKRKPGRHPLVMVGSASPRWVAAWHSLPLDMAQFHLWNGPGQIDEGVSVPATPPVTGVPNILGEFSTLAGLPQSRCDLFTAGLRNGYSGSFPWAYRARDTASLLLLGTETRACLSSLPRFTFTDGPVVSGVTPIRAVHIRELRVSADTLRTSCSLEPYGYTEATPVPGATPIRAAHFLEPREALGEYFDCRSLPRPVFPLPAPGPGVAVLGRHVTEIRAALLTAK